MEISGIFIITYCHLLPRPMVSGSAYHGLLKLRHDVSFRGEHKLGNGHQHIKLSCSQKGTDDLRSLDRLTLERHRRDGACRDAFSDKRSLLVHDLLRLRRGLGSCRVHKGELSRNVRYSVRNGGFGTGGAFRSRGSRFGKMNRPLSRKICGGSVRWALPPCALLKNPPL